MTFNKDNFQSLAKTDTGSTLIYTYKIGDYYRFFVIKSPTGNCQNASINTAEYILKLKDDEDIRQHFMGASIIADKKQLILDVYQIFEKVIDRVFKPNEILMKSKYTNGTGSEMMIVILKLR